MPSCPTCHKRLLLTGFKAAGTRYCSEACADAALLPAFTAALEAPPPRTTEIPRGTATARTGPDDALLVDREGVKPGLVIAVGVVAAVLLSVGLHALESMAEGQLRGINLWIVLPIGAALNGGLITAGFFAAARLLDTRPRLSTYVAAIATAGVLCWLTYVISYWTMTDESGAPVRDTLGLGEFMGILAEHSTIQLGRTRSSAVTAGNWGYALFAADWIGFMLGAWAVVRWAGSKPFCARCGRFMTRIGLLGRSGDDPAAAGATLNAVHAHLGANNPQRAVEALKAFGSADQKSYFAVTMKCHGCPMCKDYSAVVTTTLKGSRARRELHRADFDGNGQPDLT
jgi:hypothetical protein